MDGLGDPYLSFNSLDIRSRSLSIFSNRRLKFLGTYVSTYNNKQSHGKKKKKRRRRRRKRKRQREERKGKVKNRYQSPMVELPSELGQPL